MIHISIDELVLDGLPVADPERFRAAFEAELGRLASVHGGQLADGAAPVLHGAAVDGADPVDLAGSVWGSVVPA